LNVCAILFPPESGEIVPLSKGDQSMQFRKKNKNTIFVRVLSVFLALLIVGGSLAALIQML
jgi:hypothetical protein